MMVIEESIFSGVYEITLEPNYDNRGFFSRTYDINLFSKYGLNRNWVQENQSYSKKKYIIRGLHFQYPPFSETKLIRVVKGAILDVFVDLRTNSETFGKYGCLKVSEENHKALFIPKGFAHGFCTLSDDTIMLYKVDNFYSKENEGGIIYDDKDLNIKWPGYDWTLSEKDRKLGSFKDLVSKNPGI